MSKEITLTKEETESGEYTKDTAGMVCTVAHDGKGGFLYHFSNPIRAKSEPKAEVKETEKPKKATKKKSE